MLTDAQILNNKNEFLKLVSEINIDGANTQGLVDYLLASDFFEAPASTRYHACYKGGLCEHSLNVYHNLVRLVDSFEDKIPVYDTVSLIVVALFHDISKTNFYESYLRNVKDENGKWQSVQDYKVRDAKERFLASSHAGNSLLIVSRYIPLLEEEQVAILNHMGPTKDTDTEDLTATYNRYPLASLLHMADFMSTMIDERI